MIKTNKQNFLRIIDNSAIIIKINYFNVREDETKTGNYLSFNSVCKSNCETTNNFKLHNYY